MTAQKIFLCVDGTRNGRDDKIPTNVRLIHRGTRGAPDQISCYLAGPGNEDENNWMGQLLGGAVGWGSDDLRDTALDTLGQLYRDGDSIIVIGFSRGAMVARRICASIGEDGVNGFKPDIDFLGCFDTVSAFLPFGRGPVFRDIDVHKKVRHAVHAVAVHEERIAFTVDLMNKRAGVDERWFPGVHSDVGGGLKDRRLSDLSLGWMIERLHTLAGVHITIDHQLFAGEWDEIPVGSNDSPLPHEPRRVGVKIDGKWSEEAAVMYGRE